MRSEVKVAPAEPFSASTGDYATLDGRRSLPASIRRAALTGSFAFGLLAAIELVDVNVQSLPGFESLFGRLAFAAYFSLNLLVGAGVGLAVYLSLRAASLINGILLRLLAKKAPRTLMVEGVAGLTTAALVAILLKQHPHVHGYLVGLIREAGKLDYLRQITLDFESALSYLLAFGFVLGCGLVWIIVRASNSMKQLARTGWLLMLTIVLGAAYYADSRIQFQLYEYSFHRSMYLVAIAAAMALCFTLHSSYPAIWSVWSGLKTRSKVVLLLMACTLMITALGFTFLNFGDNEELKTQAFYRTTQLKQSAKLVQWVLDFDRDGYSALLGGGDANDTRNDINPGTDEIVGDGLDNNCIGGDLTRQSLEEWKAMFSSPGSVPDESGRGLNVIFVFIDTLRADHMSTYGYQRNTTPNIDKLAARSSVFENAYAPSPNTFGSLPCFMQSSYWDGHFPSWTQVLAENGYNGMLFARRLQLISHHVTGLNLIKQPPGEPFEGIVDVAIEALSGDETRNPFFAYLYAFDPHSPYLRHSEFDFGGSLVDRYDSEIAYSDYHLGRLINWMEESNRINDTIVVLMSDHGDSLGERGVYLHGSQLYDEQIRVPMIIYHPRLQPRRVWDYVSTIDLGSTILNAVGLEYPREYAGVSLLPLMRGEEISHPPVYAEQISREGSPYVSFDRNVNPVSRKHMLITQDGFKLIYNRDFYNFELFDLKKDREEKHNLYHTLSEKARNMKDLLGRFIDVVNVSRPWDAVDNRHAYREERQKGKQEIIPHSP